MGNLLMMGHAGFLSPEQTVDNLTLFAREVYPRLKAWKQPDAEEVAAEAVAAAQKAPANRCGERARRRPGRRDDYGAVESCHSGPRRRSPSSLHDHSRLTPR